MNTEANVLDAPRTQGVKWSHPEYTQTQMTRTEPIKASPKIIERPIYCISDLHLGDGGPRDNFLPAKEKQLLAFLDYVQQNNGKLLILGDLFELWQANWSKVFTVRERLLDRFAAMDATYILGNHDADLYHFIGTSWINHPLFTGMIGEARRTIGGRSIQFCHGHQADEYCAGLNPGLGRITAIYTGLKEDRHGGPMLDKYRTVEQKYLGPMEWTVSLLKRLGGKPDRFTEINQSLLAKYTADCIIFGHTHLAGCVKQGGRALFNCGTWAERTNNFVRINPRGTINVYDWDFGAIPNTVTLPI